MIWGNDRKAAGQPAIEFLEIMIKSGKDYMGTRVDLQIATVWIFFKLGL